MSFCTILAQRRCIQNLKGEDNLDYRAATNLVSLVHFCSINCQKIAKMSSQNVVIQGNILNLLVLLSTHLIYNYTKL